MKKPRSPAGGARPRKKNPRRYVGAPWIKLLGTKPDTELADQLGLSVSTVGWVRRSRDIDAYQARSIWKPEWDSLLGTEHDLALAKRLGVSQSTVVHHRRAAGISARASARTAEHARAAAALSDADIVRSSAITSRETGIPRWVVNAERRRRGLKRVGRGNRKAADTHIRAAVRGLVDADATASDIARVLKVSRQRANLLRHEVVEIGARRGR